MPWHEMFCSIVRMQDLVRADWHRAFQLPLHALPVFPTCSMTFAPNPGFLKCFEWISILETKMDNPWMVSFHLFFSSPLQPPTLSSFSESSSSPLFVHQLSWIEFYLFNWARDSSTFLVFPVLPALPSNCPIGAMMESCHHKLLAIVLLCGEWWRSEQRQFCWIESKFSPCAHSDPPSTRYFVTSSSS